MVAPVKIKWWVWAIIIIAVVLVGAVAFDALSYVFKMLSWYCHLLADVLDFFGLRGILGGRKK